MTPTEALLRELAEASKGLLWISENDAPWSIVHWPDVPLAALDDVKLLALTGHPAGTLVERVAPEPFFARAVNHEDWHGPNEREAVERYQKLVALLTASLESLRVYRVGHIQVDVYAVGGSPDGGTAGLSTRAIET